MTHLTLPLALGIAHAASTAFMTGLIWFVQIVHYPLFAEVGAEHSRRYALLHQSRTTAVVGPVMLLEAASACGLLLVLPEGTPRLMAWIGVAILAGIWLSTAFLQVPDHGRLKDGFDPIVGARLVRSNWLRTIAWSIRMVIAFAILVAVGSASGAA